MKPKKAADSGQVSVMKDIGTVSGPSGTPLLQTRHYLEFKPQLPLESVLTTKQDSAIPGSKSRAQMKV